MNIKSYDCWLLTVYLLVMLLSQNCWRSWCLHCCQAVGVAFVARLQMLLSLRSCCVLSGTSLLMLHLSQGFWCCHRCKVASVATVTMLLVWLELCFCRRCDCWSSAGADFVTRLLLFLEMQIHTAVSELVHTWLADTWLFVACLLACLLNVTATC